MPVVIGFVISLFFIGYRRINRNYFTVAFTFFIVLYLLFLSGMRFETGRDYNEYRENYEKIGTIVRPRLSESSVTFERGFVTIQKIIKYFSEEPYLMFFIFGLITLSIIIHELYKFNDLFFFCLFGFLSKSFFYTNLCLLRQGVAMGLSLTALRYLTIDSNRIRFVIFVLLACLFHQSAALLLIFIYIPKNRKIYLFTFIISMIICIYNYNGKNMMTAIAGVTDIFSRVSFYLDRLTKGANIFALKSFYPRIIIAIFFLHFQKNNPDIDKETSLLIWINLIDILLTGILHNFGEMFIRLTLYFEIPFVFLLAKFVTVKSIIPKIVRYGFAVGYFVFSFINLYMVWSPYLNPFKTVLGLYIK